MRLENGFLTCDFKMSNKMALNIFDDIIGMVTSTDNKTVKTVPRDYMEEDGGNIL